MGFDRYKGGKASPVTASPLTLSAAVTSLLLLGTLYAPHPARADDDPFQMDNARWMSFDHYQDATKRGIAVAPAQAPAKQSPPPAPSVAPQTAQTTTSPQIAKPSRPLNLPVMPADSAQFDVQVNSTANEEFPALPAATPPPAGEAPALPSAQGWHSPLAEATTKSDGTLSIPVRMSFLPNEAITPQAEPQHKSAQTLADTIVLHRQEAVGETTQPNKADEHAACAAIDTYRKHQLEAIRGDQRTLKALEQAISTLGLQKQLGFMTGNEPMTASTPKANAATTQTKVR
ncbi:MAG: hypothetical protein KGI37_03930 [Alphaproteobacteria bacterium]|nr:hypothetical protein [Alphaproteobacteria bacterium]